MCPGWGEGRVLSNTRRHQVMHYIYALSMHVWYVCVCVPALYFLVWGVHRHTCTGL